MNDLYDELNELLHESTMSTNGFDYTDSISNTLREYTNDLTKITVYCKIHPIIVILSLFTYIIMHPFDA
jgi:hypothetical protein